MFATHIAATNEINILDMHKYPRNTHTHKLMTGKKCARYLWQVNFLF